MTTKNQAQPALTLLEQAAAIEAQQSGKHRKDNIQTDKQLMDELALAFAYFEKRIHAPAVCAVIGKNSGGVPGWFAQIIMKGVRHGLVEIKLVGPKE